jgi:hypothetical protein
LGHRFENEHAGHDRTAREVPLEELLVDRDVFDSDDPSVQFQLANPVNQQKRIPVRKQGLDVHVLHRCHRHAS